MIDGDDKQEYAWSDDIISPIAGTDALPLKKNQKKEQIFKQEYKDQSLHSKEVFDILEVVKKKEGADVKGWTQPEVATSKQEFIAAQPKYEAPEAIDNTFFMADNNFYDEVAPKSVEQPRKIVAETKTCADYMTTSPTQQDAASEAAHLHVSTTPVDENPSWNEEPFDPLAVLQNQDPE